MKTKNYFFASANTGDGFVSHLDRLNSDLKQSFTYIIKGGPGTGKSTMMKKIAQHFYDKGYSIEEFYCSTDPKSLDAVRIVEKNVSIVDGTAPHIVEPKLVGLTHKIIDNGSFIGTGILKDVEEIIKLSKQKKICFDMLYKNLAAAKNLDDINFEIAKENIDVGIVQKKAKNLFSKTKHLVPNGESKTLFLQAINDEPLNLEKQNKFKVIAFSGDRYESFLVLGCLEKMLQTHNLPFVKILDILNPQRTNAILINNKYLIKKSPHFPLLYHSISYYILP